MAESPDLLDCFTGNGPYSGSDMLIEAAPYGGFAVWRVYYAPHPAGDQPPPGQKMLVACASSKADLLEMLGAGNG